MKTNRTSEPSRYSFIGHCRNDRRAIGTADGTLEESSDAAKHVPTATQPCASRYLLPLRDFDESVLARCFGDDIFEARRRRIV